MSMFQKHIQKVKFYPSADDFTQVPLVRLVTNIRSGCGRTQNTFLTHFVSFDHKGGWKLFQIHSDVTIKWMRSKYTKNWESGITQGPGPDKNPSVSFLVEFIILDNVLICCI